ncbi:MAG TPA: SDR family oxidoreductase [Thermoanaerobaculia bacterium]|nr:SDR family oxidoreductase [Thermoanaerobaculia bacterium]
MRSIFFTGFPGFLGAELLPRILSGDEELRATCLVQPQYAALAKERLAAMPAGMSERVELVEGDVTESIKASPADVVEIHHLAAVYDLMVRRDVAMRVNVDGTHHVLDFAERCPKLRRLHYVSTCFVSGRYPGLFRETDLEKGQTFNNYYEETKYLAEVEVQARMRGGLPGTIYRPSSVVGDSMTGATQKYDGVYFVMQWLMRQPKIAILPVVGRPREYHFNAVPCDFVVDAIAGLAPVPESLGQVYNLADPAPLTVDETIRAVASATGRLVVRVPLPRAVAKGALDHVPGMYRLMRIPSASVDYFVHPTEYDTTNLRRDLPGVKIPNLRDYLPRLVEFVRAHPEIGSAAMV